MDIPKIEELTKSKLGRLYIKKNYPEFYEYLLNRYSHIKWTKFSELLYCYYHNLDDRPKCKCCNNPVDFLSMNDGYRIYCSCKCAVNDSDVQLKIKNTVQERYGDNKSIIVEKVKKTKLERYGNSNYNNMDKNKSTKLAKYGDEYYTNKDKAKKTNIKIYGVENPMQNKEVCKKSIHTREEKYGKGNTTNRVKFKQTCLERYGVENVFQLDEVKQKSKQTCIERYGVDHNMKSDVIKENARKTKKERHGDENYNNREKYKATNLQKYGVENSGGTQESIDKIKQATLNNYGVEWYTQTEEYKQYIKDNNDLIQDKIYNTKKQNHTFSTSNIEIEFKQWLDDNNIEYKYQYKSEEYPFNCDFWFPKQNLYLEIQGSWTHGKHPFNPNDNNDLMELNNWKSKETQYYNNAIYVWTIRDPKKRTWVKEHNLNWIEFFTNDINELIEYAKKYII